MSNAAISLGAVSEIDRQELSAALRNSPRGDVFVAEQCQTTHGEHLVVNATIRPAVDLHVGAIRLAVSGRSLFIYLPDTILQVNPRMAARELTALVTVIAPPDRGVQRRGSQVDPHADMPLVMIGQGETRVDVMASDL